MWFEECFPRGETRAFAGAVKEAMAYAEVKGRGIRTKRLLARSPHPTLGRNGAEPSLARPPLYSTHHS